MHVYLLLHYQNRTVHRRTFPISALLVHIYIHDGVSSYILSKTNSDEHHPLVLVSMSTPLYLDLHFVNLILRVKCVEFFFM
jgi:hypothetical protein